QDHRYKGLSFSSNHFLEGKYLKHHCKLDSIAKVLLNDKYKTQNWSNRAYFKIIKLARTIADLHSIQLISDEHILEAIFFQNTGWN
ncbi:magnesium chelatase, partial [bacterium]|nr:magnesium chelatase [bacterium]